MDKYPREHLLVNNIECKECKQCKEIIELGMYHNDSNTKDGLRGICKNCIKENTKNPKGVKRKARETYQNYDWLYDNYVTQNKTLAEISREINVKNETIKNWLFKFEIPLKTPSESRNRMIETNDEYREYLNNAYINVFSKYEPGFKGHTWSEEDKKRIGEDRKKFFSIPENREKQLKHLNKINTSKEVSNKISDTRKRKIANGEIITWNKGLTNEIDSRILAGESHPLFNNWASLGEYGKEFTEELKLRIIERDNYCCQECGKSNEQSKEEIGKKLAIHHIDYDKQNCGDYNLIALCFSCHAKTNFNRDYWECYFKEVIEKKIQTI